MPKVLIILTFSFFTLHLSGATLMASASAGSNSHQSTAYPVASVTASDYWEDDYGYFRITMFASAQPTLVRVNSSNVIGGYLEDYWILGGSAYAVAKGKAKIIGGSGMGFVSFDVYGGAYDGCADFEALGAHVSDCSGDGLDATDIMPFIYGQEFDYELSVSAYRDLGLDDLENFASWAGGSIYDSRGRYLDSARIVLDGEPDSVPEPSTLILTLGGLALVATRRRA